MNKIFSTTLTLVSVFYGAHTLADSAPYTNDQTQAKLNYVNAGRAPDYTNQTNWPKPSDQPATPDPLSGIPSGKS